MKRMTVFLSALLLLLCVLIPVSAADPIPYICDTASLLTEDACTRMERQAAEISAQYQCAVYFVTVEDYTDYGSGSIYQVAKSIYKANDLGWGTDKSGVMLLLSMADRDYTLIAYGYGNTAFTDYGKDYLSDRFLDDFADDDWESGCGDYLSTCEKMLELARDGSPVDVGAKPKVHLSFWQNLIPSFLAALLICFIWRLVAKKEVHESREAGSYISSGGMKITLRQDTYTHTTRTVRTIEKPSNGGGTSVGSGGFSGKSGKF